MRAEKVISYLLNNATAVTTLLGAGKVYPLRLPQGSAMPALAYELVSSNEVLPITALAGGVLLRSRVQVTAFGKNYADVKSVHEAVRKALLYQSGLFQGVRVNSITRDSIGADSMDWDLNLYMQSVDYLLVHDET